MGFLKEPLWEDTISMPRTDPALAEIEDIMLRARCELIESSDGFIRYSLLNSFRLRTLSFLLKAKGWKRDPSFIWYHEDLPFSRYYIQAPIGRVPGRIRYPACIKLIDTELIPKQSACPY